MENDVKQFVDDNWPPKDFRIVKKGVLWICWSKDTTHHPIPFGSYLTKELARMAAMFFQMVENTPEKTLKDFEKVHRAVREGDYNYLYGMVVGQPLKKWESPMSTRPTAKAIAKLIWKHGKDFTDDQLSAVGLNRSDLTPEIFARAEKLVRKRLRREAEKDIDDVLKVAKSIPSVPIPPVGEGNWESITNEERAMKVDAKPLKQMFTDMGIEGVQKWSSERLASKVNSLPELLEGVDLNGESAKLAKLILEALEGNKKIVVSGSKETEKAKKPKSKPTKAHTNGNGDGHMSLIDAAAKVVRESQKPLSRADIFERVVSKGYWKATKGKTPQDTLKAAIYVEIKTKGKDARFKKSGRGLFVKR